MRKAIRDRAWMITFILLNIVAFSLAAWTVASTNVGIEITGIGLVFAPVLAGALVVIAVLGTLLAIRHREGDEADEADELDEADEDEGDDDGRSTADKDTRTSPSDSGVNPDGIGQQSTQQSGNSATDGAFAAEDFGPGDDTSDRARSSHSREAPSVAAQETEQAAESPDRDSLLESDLQNDGDSTTESDTSNDTSSTEYDDTGSSTASTSDSNTDRASDADDDQTDTTSAATDDKINPDLYSSANDTEGTDDERRSGQNEKNNNVGSDGPINEHTASYHHHRSPY